MPRPFIFLVIVALLAGGCERRDDSAAAQDKAAEALRDVLAYPRSTLVSYSAGSEAAEIVLSTPAPVEEVAGWYRRTLSLNNWVVKTDTRDRSGNATLYAERQQRPLWITMQPNAGAVGTTYKLVGVFAVDSVKKGSAR